MKTGDLIALLAAFVIIAGIYFAKDIVPYINEVWNSTKECPACEAQKPCPDCPPCKKSSSSSGVFINGRQVIVDGEVVSGQGTMPNGINRVYLTKDGDATGTSRLVIKYNELMDLRNPNNISLKDVIVARRALFAAVDKDKQERIRVLNDQCSSYDIYNGIDRPYIEFSKCVDKAGVTAETRPQ